MSERSQTILLWWSIIFGVLFVIAFAGLLQTVPPPPATFSAAEVAAYYTEHAFQIKLGAMLASWSAGFLVPFSLVAALQLARMEKGTPVWSILTFGGGTISSIFLVIPPLLWGAAAFTTTRPPEVTAMVNEIANLALVTTDQYYLFLMIPFVYVGLNATPDSNPTFPRWYSWATLWLCIFIEAGAAAFMFKSGPFAWRGIFVFWIPFGGFALWIIPAYCFMFRALKRQADERPEAE